jgi:hypothetical protein
VVNYLPDYEEGINASRYMAVKLAAIAFDHDFFAWLAQSGSVTDGAHRVIRWE